MLQVGWYDDMKYMNVSPGIIYQQVEFDNQTCFKTCNLQRQAPVQGSALNFVVAVP